jgi:hypothetical protein
MVRQHVLNYIWIQNIILQEKLGDMQSEESRSIFITSSPICLDEDCMIV